MSSFFWAPQAGEKLVSAYFVVDARVRLQDGECFLWCAIVRGLRVGRAALADFQGGFENCRDGNYAREFVGAHGGEAHGGEASAARAVGMAAELAGSDLRLQVGGHGCGCERENAVLGTTGRRGKLADHDLGHVELGILFSQLQHIDNCLRALAGREYFRQVISDLGSEHTEPHFFNFGTRRPEF